MYSRDQRDIQSLIAPGAANWENRAASAYLMVTFTIRTLTPAVLTHCKMFGHGDMGKLYMKRRSAYDIIQSGAHVDVFNRAHAAVVNHDLRSALVALCDLPGLGFAKAGFLVQLCFGEVGCIDARNMRQFGVKEIRFDARKDREGRMRDAAGYVALCERLGGSERLWDNWCNGVASQWPKSMKSGDHVSRLHVLWLLYIHAGLWQDGAALYAAQAIEYPR